MRTSLSFAAAFFVSAILVAPDIAAAAGAAIPSTSSETSQQTSPGNSKKSHAKKKTTNNKSSSLEDFITGYEAAYALVYDKGEYRAGIAALRALDHDDNPDVATLLGYASRKLGRYDDAKVWYERALAADPQAEQGNVLKAKDDLEKVRLICGTDCKPYKMLKDAIDGAVTY
jgi:tetratricopeptide (TPR) repeat protein